MRRPVFLLALAVLTAACAERALLRIEPGAAPVLVGDYVQPSSNVRGQPRMDVGGLSGAYFDSAARRLWTVVDDRQRPRVIGFEVALGPPVTLTRRELITLEAPRPGQTLDAEGIAPAPNGHWFVSSEGDPRGETQPLAGIHEYTRQGQFVRSLPLPAAYHPVAGETPSGIRLNLSFEALGASPDGRWLFAGLESSLIQDGPPANFDAGAVVRLLVYDLRNPAAGPREYAYRTDPMKRPSEWTATDGDAGVVDLLAVSARELLVLERAYVVEDPTPTSRRENAIHLYRVRLDRSSEVTGRHSLAAQPPRTLEKELILDLSSIAPQLTERLRKLENFEAIAFGPPLADGTPTILLISDDNFSPAQVTALIALRFPL